MREKQMHYSTYPGIFKDSKDGGYIVEFPDFDQVHLLNCNSFEEAIDNAADVLIKIIISKLIYEVVLPKPSNIDEIEITENEIVRYVNADIEKYKIEGRTGQVKHDIYIPIWLDDLAKINSYDYSGILINALIDKLNLSSPEELKSSDGSVSTNYSDVKVKRAVSEFDLNLAMKSTRDRLLDKYPNDLEKKKKIERLTNFSKEVHGKRKS